MEKEKGLIEETIEGVSNLLDSTDKIEDLLVIWNELNISKRKINEIDDRIRNKIKAFLKEKGWERYVEEKTDISVTLAIHKKRSIDQQQLKMILSDAQMAQVTRTTTYEKLMIVTPEARERLKQIVKKPKKIGEIATKNSKKES